MKYKAWANDKKWLPEGPGCHMLNGIPQWTPSLVRPDTNKMLSVHQLKENTLKCKRLSSEDRQWWDEFIQKEEMYRKNGSLHLMKYWEMKRNKNGL